MNDAHWRVKYDRGRGWEYVLDPPPQHDFLEVPPPHQYGRKYLATLSAAAVLFEKQADRVEIERVPPLTEPEPKTETHG